MITSNYWFISYVWNNDISTDYTSRNVAEPAYDLNIDCPVIGLDFASYIQIYEDRWSLGPDILRPKYEVYEYYSNKIPNRKICDTHVLDHNENEDLKSLMVEFSNTLFDQCVTIEEKC